jgi:transposase
MKKQVKQYSAEEKAKVAIEAITGEMTIAQITSKYGVHANQIYRWKKEALEYMVSGFKTKAKQQDKSQEDLVKSLFEQIGQLTVERDWLKKKSNIFGFGG